MAGRLQPVLLPLAVAVFTLIVLLLFRGLAFKVLRRYGRRAEPRIGIDELVVRSLSWPSFFWCIAISLHVGVGVSDLPGKYALFFSSAIDVIVIFSVTLAAANVCGSMLKSYIQSANFPTPPTGLIYGILKGLIFLVGVLVTLHTLGISILPVVTTLGIGGLAVALALQDTLANLFSGIQILMEKSLRIGDYIKVETGEQGYVEDITWRSTKLRMAPDNVVIIPNSKMAKSAITNYSQPGKKMAVSIAVRVDYASDPDHIEAILLEEANKAVGQVPGLVKEPEPIVRLAPGFGDYGLEFTLICQAASYGEQFLVQHELRKRILKRLRQEGVTIPAAERAASSTGAKN
ncbi:MAG TPA: mechanosensitive ion channel family protein [Syntrophorhabdales bacterium]|nr:mechanosensitive ion channel family protein [Syntrophorhabdales bacterium]